MEVGFWRFTSMTPFFHFFTNRIHGCVNFSSFCALGNYRIRQNICTFACH